MNAVEPLTQFGGVLLLAYWTVLIAELAGDKLLYQVASLTMRFRGSQVLGGISLAFGVKMLAAVLLGQTLTSLPRPWLALLSALVFSTTAVFIWIHSSQTSAAVSPHQTWFGAATVSFGSVVFSEWADAGQIAAALLTARSGLPLAVWIGGTTAMATKALLAFTVGVKLVKYLPKPKLGRIAVAMCLLLAAASLVEALAK